MPVELIIICAAHAAVYWTAKRLESFFAPGRLVMVSWFAPLDRRSRYEATISNEIKVTAKALIKIWASRLENFLQLIVLEYDKWRDAPKQIKKELRITCLKVRQPFPSGVSQST